MRTPAERASEAVLERIQRAGIFERTEDGGYANTDGITSPDDPRVNLVFEGMDIDQQDARGYLEIAVETHVAMLLGFAALDLLTPDLLAATVRGIVYQTMLFGWEIARMPPPGEDAPDAPPE